MARKAVVTTPHSFVIIKREGTYIYTAGTAKTEQAALNLAKAYINRHRTSEHLGIYRLHSTVKAKEIPVEVITEKQ